MTVNLDEFSADSADLLAWFHAHKYGRKCAAVLFPDKPPGFVRATRSLAHYAANKATAMQCRGRGDIETALSYERICERIYESLPTFAKW